MNYQQKHNHRISLFHRYTYRWTSPIGFWKNSSKFVHNFFNLLTEFWECGWFNAVLKKVNPRCLSKYVLLNKHYNFYYIRGFCAIGRSIGPLRICGYTARSFDRQDKNVVLQIVEYLIRYRQELCLKSIFRKYRIPIWNGALGFWTINHRWRFFFILYSSYLSTSSRTISWISSFYKLRNFDRKQSQLV